MSEQKQQTSLMMIQQDQKPLIIEPANELHFTGPFNRAILTVMTLKNTTDRTMVFKIKTTAPKKYCVRPNIGKIMPKESTSVEICLQPFGYDPNEKNKHKFMVQSVIAPEGIDLTDLNKLWKDLDPNQMIDAKLKCVLEMPSTTNTTSENSGSATNEIVNKKEEVHVLSSEKPSNLIESDQTESLLVEVKQLREGNGAMRKEILTLKEQLIASRLPPKELMNEPPYAMTMAEKQIPIFYIAIAIAAAFLGLVLGKLFL